MYQATEFTKRSAILTFALTIAASAASAQPSAPAAPVVTVTGSGNKANVAWTAVKGTTTYMVMRRIMSLEPDGRILATQAWGAMASVPGGPFVDALPKPSMIYEYRVDATQRDGSVLSSATVQYTAPAYTTPTNLRITGSGSQVNLTWTPATAVNGYLVMRTQQKSTTGRVQLTPSPIGGSTFTDVLTLTGVVYEYEVVAVDPLGGMFSSGIVPYSAPIAGPTVAIVGTGDQAQLSWTQTNGATFYDVLRETLDASGQVIAKLVEIARALQTTSYTDPMLEPGARHRYTILARGYDGNPIVSSNATTFTVANYLTPVGIIATGGGGKVSLSWRAANGVTGYQVTRRTVRADGTTFDATAPSKMQASTDFVDVIPTPGLIYEYQIVGVGRDGRLWPSAWTRFTSGTW
jgi:hypothetical protein